MSKKIKILIAGGTGFIGSFLAKECLKKRWQVDILSNKKIFKSKKNKKINYIICDISNFKKLKRKIKPNYDYVINLTGYIEHTSKKKTFQVHYNGCKNLANIFKNRFPKSFVQVGSSLEYGKLKSPHKENNFVKKINLKTNYASAKFLATKHILNLCKENNFPGVIIRFYQVYGQGQRKERRRPFIIDSCKKNKKFPCSSGIQSRDFLYVSDAVNAIFKIFNSKKKIYGEIFNIGYGKAIQIKKVILLIKKIVKKGTPMFGKIKLRKEESLVFFPSIAKAKKILNWRPKISLNKGIELAIRN